MYIQSPLYEHLIMWTSHYYGQFALSLGKGSHFIFCTFNPLYSDIPLIQTISQPRSRGSLLPIPMERESKRDLGWVWTHVMAPEKILILREESFCLSIICLVCFHCSHNDCKSKIVLLTLQL